MEQQFGGENPAEHPAASIIPFEFHYAAHLKSHQRMIRRERFQEVVTLTLVFWRCGPDCDIRYGMEGTMGSRSVSLPWKLLILFPLAVAVVLAVIGSRQTDLHAEVELNTIAGICGNVALIALGVHWIVVKKLTGLGIFMLIVASTVLGFGMHVLLRMF